MQRGWQEVGGGWLPGAVVLVLLSLWCCALHISVGGLWLPHGDGRITARQELAGGSEQHEREVECGSCYPGQWCGLNNGRLGSFGLLPYEAHTWSASSHTGPEAYSLGAPDPGPGRVLGSLRRGVSRVPPR